MSATREVLLRPTVGSAGQMRRFDNYLH